MAAALCGKKRSWTGEYRISLLKVPTRQFPLFPPAEVGAPASLQPGRQIRAFLMFIALPASACCHTITFFLSPGIFPCKLFYFTVEQLPLFAAL